MPPPVSLEAFAFVVRRRWRAAGNPRCAFPDADVINTGNRRARICAAYGPSPLPVARFWLRRSADDLKVTFDEVLRPTLSTLRGRNTQGNWRLTVQDLAAADVGTLNKLWLEFAVSAASPNIELQESPGVGIPDNSSAGIERMLVTAEAGNVASVEVSVDISHTYIGDLRVRLRAPSGAKVVLHDRAGGSSDNIASTYIAATTPALATHAGSAVSGNWKLLISDLEAVDIGKLNRWSLVIRRATAASLGAGG